MVQEAVRAEMTLATVADIVRLEQKIDALLRGLESGLCLHVLNPEGTWDRVRQLQVIGLGEEVVVGQAASSSEPNPS